MCGIAGIIDRGEPVDESLIVRMRDTLSHRGPDDAGFFVSADKTVALGHRRLSILDLSENGRQPMITPDGQTMIVYNGEVYNFRHLRDQLRREGVAFHTDTDTEVVLQACRAWGESFVDHIEGMFALAVWNVATQTLLLVRDRLGIKPLHFALTPGGLIFGSEIRAILAAGRVSEDLSPEAAWDFFTYGYIPTPATIYRQVSKLPPATILRYHAPSHQVQLLPYWSPSCETLEISPGEARRRLTERVDRAVEDYLVADVETGSYLSGGLDSSLVTQRAADIFRDEADSHRLGGASLKSFTIGFDVAEHSEVDFARLAAKTYGTEHRELIVSREMAHAYTDTIVDLFDEPFAASSTIPMTFLAELARQQVTVALCGEGGDEIFGGYSWYRHWLRYNDATFWKTPAGQLLRKVAETLRGRPKKQWRLAAMDGVELYAALMGAMSEDDKAGVFSADLARTMGDRDPAGTFRQHWRDDLPPMARLQYLDLKTFLPDLNLTRADRTSMRVGLELRVPLLNHLVVEYALGLPQAVRNPGGQLKGLFRQSFQNRLPEVIRTRRKKGFSSPVKQWFNPEDLARLADDVLHERPGLAGSWLNRDLPAHARRLGGSRAYKLWVFLRWMQRHA